MRTFSPEKKAFYKKELSPKIKDAVKAIYEATRPTVIASEINYDYDLLWNRRIDYLSIHYLRIICPIFDFKGSPLENINLIVNNLIHVRSTSSEDEIIEIIKKAVAKFNAPALKQFH